MGENAAARFIRDVVSRPNIKAVVLLMGINDISWPGQRFDPNNPRDIKEELQADHLHLSPAGNKLVADAMTPAILFGDRTARGRGY